MQKDNPIFIPRESTIVMPDAPTILPVEQQKFRGVRRRPWGLK